MILFNIGKSLEDFSQKINAFLDNQGSNPLFWSILVLLLFIIAYWGIQYFNKR